MKRGKSLYGITCLFVSIVIFFGMCQIVAAENTGASTDDSLISSSHRELDVVLVIDNSWDTWEQQEIRNDVMTAASYAVVRTKVRGGCVCFADRMCKKYTLKEIKNEEEYRQIAGTYFSVKDKDSSNMNVNIGAGLKTALELFEEQNSDRKKAVILLSADVNKSFYSINRESYEKGADQSTADQVKALRKNNVELYCISLNGQNNKDYLTKLVNYFDDTNVFDDRLVCLNPENTDDFCSEMTKMFYSLRENVIYTMPKLDSDYSCSFELPKIPVSRLQVYVRGNNVENNALFVNLSGSNKTGEILRWNSRQTYFRTVENPSSDMGWFLQISSSDKRNLRNMTVILAYDIDMTANIRLEHEGEVLKGQNVKLDCFFRDRNGQTVEPDSQAEVTAEVSFFDSSRTSVFYPVILEKTNDGRLNGEFSAGEFGKIVVGIHIGYDSKNTGVDYWVDTKCEIVPHAPQILKPYVNPDIQPEKITADSKTFYRFVIPLSEYVTDVDSPLSELIVADVNQYDKNSPVTVYIQNDNLFFETEQCVALDCGILLADETNNTSEFRVQGTITNPEKQKIILLVIIATAVILLGVSVLLARRFYLKWQNNRRLRREWDDFCREQKVPEFLKNKLLQENAHDIGGLLERYENMKFECSIVVTKGGKVFSKDKRDGWFVPFDEFLYVRGRTTAADYFGKNTDILFLADKSSNNSPCIRVIEKDKQCQIDMGREETFESASLGMLRIEAQTH